MTQDVVHKLEHAFSMGYTDLEACIYAERATPNYITNVEKILNLWSEKRRFFVNNKDLQNNPFFKIRGLSYLVAELIVLGMISIIISY